MYNNEHDLGSIMEAVTHIIEAHQQDVQLGSIATSEELLVGWEKRQMELVELIEIYNEAIKYEKNSIQDLERVNKVAQETMKNPEFVLQQYLQPVQKYCIELGWH